MAVGKACGFGGSLANKDIARTAHSLMGVRNAGSAWSGHGTPYMLMWPAKGTRFPILGYCTCTCGHASRSWIRSHSLQERIAAEALPAMTTKAAGDRIA